MQKKQGISLIVLVITIIVMIILAASVVISLNNTGVIEKANTAVKLTDKKQIENLLSLAWADAYAGGVRTQEGLQDAVDEAIENNNIDKTKYDIVVSTSGIIVKEKEGTEDTTNEFVLTGEWLFNETLVMPEETIEESSIDFISNSEEHTGMQVGTTLVYSYEQSLTIAVEGGFVDSITTKPTPDDNTTTSVTAYNGSWTNTVYRTVDFGTASYTVAEAFYNWFTTNAIKQ